MKVNQFKDGKKHGKWQAYFEYGETANEGNYVNGEKDGEWIYYNPIGSLAYKEFYKDGYREGKYISYHQNGEIRTMVLYKNGKREGKYIFNSILNNKKDRIKFSPKGICLYLRTEVRSFTQIYDKNTNKGKISSDT